MIRKSKVPLTVPRIQWYLWQKFTEHTPRYDIVVPNAFIGRNESDFVGIRKSGYLDEIEIKLTRSDFKADFKKVGRRTWGASTPKHELLQKGELAPNYFYFAVPKGLVSPDEVPDHCGLIELDGYWVSVVREAPRLHTRKLSDERRHKIAMKVHYKYWNAVNTVNRQMGEVLK